jgi:hypothetical protein
MVYVHKFTLLTEGEKTPSHNNLEPNHNICKVRTATLQGRLTTSRTSRFRGPLLAIMITSRVSKDQIFGWNAVCWQSYATSKLQYFFYTSDMTSQTTNAQYMTPKFTAHSSNAA